MKDFAEWLWYLPRDEVFLLITGVVILFIAARLLDIRG